MAIKQTGRITRKYNIQGKDIEYKDYEVVVLYHNNSKEVISNNSWNVWLCVSYSVYENKITYTGRLEGLVEYMLNNPTTLFIFNNLTFYADYILEKLPCEYNMRKFNTTTYFLTLYTKDNQTDIIDFKQVCPNVSYESICKSLHVKYIDIDVCSIDRDRNYQASKEEIETACNKAKRLAYFLKPMIDNKLLQGYTLGQCSLKHFISTKSERALKNIFCLNKEQDSFIRNAYIGGWHYIPKDIIGKEYRNVIDYDVNSLYPYVMYNELMPIGEPCYFEKSLKNVPTYAKLYVGKFNLKCSLKKNHIPSLTRRITVPTTNTTIGTEPVFKTLGVETFYLTNIDFEEVLKHYDISYMEVEEGYYWVRTSDNLFKTYIDEFISIKEQARKEGDVAKTKVAKLFLNSLYGKLGQRGNTYHTNVAIAAFITAYARRKLLKVVSKAQEKGIFLYSHTDSIHVLSPLDIPIGDKLGEWKIEEEFSKATYFSKGSYKGINNKGKSVIKAVGLPKDCRTNITYDIFKPNETYSVIQSQYDTTAHRYLFKEGKFTLQKEE